MFRQTYINILSNVGVLALKLTITFVMTPVLVRNLGNHDYGIWEITMSLVGYFGFLEVGLRPAVTRFAARYRSLDQPEELQAFTQMHRFFSGFPVSLRFPALWSGRSSGRTRWHSQARATGDIGGFLYHWLAAPDRDAELCR